MIKYYIIPYNDIDSIDFGKVIEHKENLRYSLDGSLFVIKTSKIAEQKLLSNYTAYSHKEIRIELSSSEWTATEE